jgi:hypothetical protein
MALTSPVQHVRPHAPVLRLPLASTVVPLPLAVVLTLVGGAIGAALDKATGQQVLVLFTVGLSVGAAVGALAVQRWHLFAAVVAVPLAWLLLVVLGAVVAPGLKLSYTVGIDFTLKAPAVFISTGVAAVLALGRRALRR